MPVDLEIRVPISATESFFRRIHFMAASLERLGEALPPWRLSVFVGHDADPLAMERLYPWTQRYPIDWFWSDPALYRERGYWVNSLDCVSREVSSRWLMFVDGDVIFVKAFPELFRLVQDEHSIAGVIAHWPPVPDAEVKPMWKRLFREFGLGEPPLQFQHSGWGYIHTSPETRFTPAYYNYGVVLGRGEEMSVLCRHLPTTLDFLASRTEQFFSYQIGTTLVMYRHGYPGVRVAGSL